VAQDFLCILRNLAFKLELMASVEARAYNPRVLEDGDLGGSYEQKLHEIPSQPMAGCSGSHLLSQLSGEAQIGGLWSKAGLGIKETLSQK
jgi:hypothetical protein